MPQADYLELQEFYGIEPFGLMIQDASQAHLCSIVANVNRDATKRPEAYELDDFLLFTEKKEPAPVLLDDPDKQTEAMIAGMFGADRVKRA